MATSRFEQLALLLCACHAAEPIELPPQPVSASDRSPSEQLPGPVQSLGLGIGYTCALLTGGAVKCWGSAAHGVLGQPSTSDDISEPSQIEPIDFGDERRVVQLSAGWYHVCVLFEDEHARCWGRNERGQLGRGNSDDYGDDPGETLRALPDLPLERVMQISAGVSNTCALLRSGDGREGTVHCFGSDLGGAIGDALSGDFGDDEPLDALRPAALPETATAIVAGDSVNCARLRSGAVRCWGNNSFGTLGVGDEVCRQQGEAGCARALEQGIDEPVQSLGQRFIVELQLNQAHACALDNRGQLSCWGRNDQSRAGYPDALYGTVLAAPPGPVSLGAGVNVVQVGLGVRHGCALDAQGQIRCWGEAGPQLGYGIPREDGVAGIGGTREPSAQYELMPERGVVQLGDADGEPGPDRSLRLFSGGRHNCAILVSGGVRCWGSNESGELGYGSFSQIGNIGDLGTPAERYAALNQYDVCIAPGITSGCSN